MSNSNNRILIIDNDEGIVAALSARLEAMGYTCITAGTGAQGLASFQEQNINLVITDLNMPAGDGIVLAQRLRETSEVPIIVVTGFREVYHEQLRFISNLTVLEKPFDSNVLLELVETELVLSGCELPAANS